MKKTIREGSMSDIDVMAKEAVSFKDFVKEFYKEFRDFPKTKDAMKWLEDTYKSVSEGTESDDLERVADGLPQTVEETINEIALSSAGVRDFLRALYRNNNIIKKLGFANFKGVVDYIRGSGGRDWDELRDEATAFGLQFESINEASYDFGKKQYTDKNMTPVEILDLAMAYSKTPIMKLVGNKHEYRIRSANDLAKLTGTTQSDVKIRGKQPALILFLLKNKLVSKDEYTKLYKDLLAKQIEVIKYLKNSSPEMRGAAGAARAAAKDMKGEFEESVTEGDEKTPEEILMGLREMAMGNLERIADYANMIETRMGEGQELSSWMYSQITIALENLNAVHDAMDGNDGEREPMKEEKPGLWANIRAKQARGEKPAHGNSDAHKDAVKAGKKINNEDHSGDPSDKYVVRPCKHPIEKWAVWEGETRVKGFKTQPEAQAFADMKNKEQGLTEVGDAIDTISMDIPLFIRTLEFAREDAKTDMDLHDFSERAIKLTKEKGTIDMSSYNELIGGSSVNEGAGCGCGCGCGGSK